MTGATASAGYSRTQIALHWGIAALVVAQYLFKGPISTAWDAVRQGLPFDFNPLILAHVVGGILILALVVWRFALRMKHGAPPPPEAEHPVLQVAARVAHWAFYALLVALSTTGLMAWFGGIQPAGNAHGVLKTGLLALIVLHVLATVVHQTVLKTNVLRRMMRPVS